METNQRRLEENGLGAGGKSTVDLLVHAAVFRQRRRCQKGAAFPYNEGRLARPCLVAGFVVFNRRPEAPAKPKGAAAAPSPPPLLRLRVRHRVWENLRNR